MKQFIVYDDNGKITRTGTCSDSDLLIQGDNVIEGVADDSIHMIVDGQVVDKPVDTEDLLVELRNIRNIILTDTDWTQIPDAPLTDEQKAQYRAYRQALRDLPSKYDTITDIAEVNFPRLEDY
jgi:hypothetical protein